MFAALVKPLIVVIGVVGTVVLPASAHAEGCAGSGEAVGDSVAVSVECIIGAESDSGDRVTSSDTAPRYVEYRWVSACTSLDVPSDPSAVLDCAAARSCPDPVERVWRLWGRTVQPAGWALLGAQCFGEPPTIADTPLPQVTPGLVLDAIRRLGLPELTAQTQPAGKTLVNFATIFYAEPEPFARTIELLGQQVDVEATATQFTWHHGDGTSESTASPGAPYPSKEITYSYTDAHTTVGPSVDVTYTARFSVSGGEWQDIDETVTIAGPSIPLRISEATAVLSGDYE